MTPETLVSLPLEQRFRLFCQWLGNQPARGEYRFSDCRHCAMAQFARSLEGVTPITFVSASATDVAIVDFRRRLNVRIRLIPELPGFTKFGLLTNEFGRAYNTFARAAGLPRRSRVREVSARLIARFVKHPAPLAA